MVMAEGVNPFWTIKRWEKRSEIQDPFRQSNKIKGACRFNL